MTYEQFVEAAKYAISTLDQEQIDYGWYIIGKTHLYDLPEDIESALNDGMDEWCNDNDIDPDEWRKEWDIIDVWCDGQADDTDSVNESYSETKYAYSTQTKGSMMEGLKGFLSLMLDYEKYCKAALTDIANYYKKLGMTVISAMTEGETSNGGDGFVIKLDRKSVEDYLRKNGFNYDDYGEEDAEYLDDYKADDLQQLTLGGWHDCGKNATMMFETLWVLDEHYKVGEATMQVPNGDKWFTFDKDTGNTVTIEYHPEVFEAMDNILDKAVESWYEPNIIRCMRYA
jgi:hypothetical protein